MAILAQLDLTTSINNLVATMGAAATVNILLTNRTNVAINVSVALVPVGTGVPAAMHWIDYQVPLDAHMALERTGIPLAMGDQVFVNPSATGVSCSVIGLVI
jgi:hypothetical protein